MQDKRIPIYHVTMDGDDKLGVKLEVLVGMYTAIDAKARQLAPQEVKNELVISQDGRVKNRFYIQVSDRMVPHLMAAIQQQADSEHGIGMRSYFYRLQEHIMSQMFAGVKDVIG